MLTVYEPISDEGGTSVVDFFDKYVSGLCVPKECLYNDTSLSIYNRYFNFSSDLSMINITLVDVKNEAIQKSNKLSSTATIMIVVFIFLIILGVLGLVVEKTNIGNKPNLGGGEDEEEEDDKNVEEERAGIQEAYPAIRDEQGQD